jgi:hypothetical protein
MDVGATNGRTQNSDENVKFANLWNRNLVEPKTGCALFLYERFHCLHTHEIRRRKTRSTRLLSKQRMGGQPECWSIGVME